MRICVFDFFSHCEPSNNETTSKLIPFAWVIVVFKWVGELEGERIPLLSSICDIDILAYIHTYLVCACVCVCVLCVFLLAFLLCFSAALRYCDLAQQQFTLYQTTQTRTQAGWQVSTCCCCCCQRCYFLYLPFVALTSGDNQDTYLMKLGYMLWPPHHSVVVELRLVAQPWDFRIQRKKYIFFFFYLSFFDHALEYKHKKANKERSTDWSVSIPFWVAGILMII